MTPLTGPLRIAGARRGTVHSGRHSFTHCRGTNAPTHPRPTDPRPAPAAAATARPASPGFRSDVKQLPVSAPPVKPATWSGLIEALAFMRMQQSAWVDYDRGADCPNACEGGSYARPPSRRCCIHEERRSRSGSPLVDISRRGRGRPGLSSAPPGAEVDGQGAATGAPAAAPQAEAGPTSRPRPRR